MKHSRKKKSRDNLLGLVLKYEASNFYFMQRMGKYKYLYSGKIQIFVETFSWFDPNWDFLFTTIPWNLSCNFFLFLLFYWTLNIKDKWRVSYLTLMLKIEWNNEKRKSYSKFQGVVVNGKLQSSKPSNNHGVGHHGFSMWIFTILWKRKKIFLHFLLDVKIEDLGRKNEWKLRFKVDCYTIFI